MSKFNFARVKQNIVAVKRDMPRLLANDSQNYFLNAFRQQGWDGRQWDEVERRTQGTRAYRYPKTKGLSRRTKPILIGTGRMRREVSNMAGAARITYSAYNFTVTLRINQAVVPYAGYQNFGTNNIKPRKFMGDSPALRRILRKRIDSYLDKAWKKAV